MGMGPREMAIVNGRRLKAETERRKGLEAELESLHAYAVGLERDNDTLLGIIAGERDTGRADLGVPDRPAVMDRMDAAALDRATDAAAVQAIVEEYVSATGKAPKAKGAAPVVRALFGADGLREGAAELESGKEPASILGAYGYMGFHLRDFLSGKRLVFRGSEPYGAKGGRRYLLVTLEVAEDVCRYVAGCDNALGSRRLNVTNVGHVLGVVTDDLDGVRRLEGKVGSGEFSGEVLVTECDHMVPMAGKANTMRIVGRIAAKEDLQTDRMGCTESVGNDIGYYAGIG